MELVRVNVLKEGICFSGPVSVLHFIKQLMEYRLMNSRGPGVASGSKRLHAP